MWAAIRVLAVVCVVGVLTAGCGAGQKKEPSMTPEDANNELTAVARAVMQVLSPGESVDLREDGPPSPCGGPGGNEYHRIKYGLTLEAPTQPTGDPSSVFASVSDRLHKLGYTVSDQDTTALMTRLKFHGEAVGGVVSQRNDGTWHFGAETECLDNPDEDSPVPHVQPS